MKSKTRMGKLTLGLLAVTVLIVGSSISAHADLIGDTVGTRYVGAGDTGVNLDVVGPGEDGNFFSNQFYDYGASSFSIRSTSTFCGIWTCSPVPISLELTSLDLGSPITSVTFSTSLLGVIESHTATSVTFTWIEQSLPATTYLSAEFNTGTAVPEPATLSLMFAGIVALGAIARKRSA